MAKTVCFFSLDLGSLLILLSDRGFLEGFYFTLLIITLDVYDQLKQQLINI